MNIRLFIFALFFPLTMAVAQEPYKCNVGGSMVYQDRPCDKSARRSDSMPPKKTALAEIQAPSDQISDQASKLEQDKAYIDQRVKVRIFEREKDQANEQIQVCDAHVLRLDRQISQVANGYQRGSPLTAADAMALQLDAQRRQNEISSLQSQAASQRHECDQLRKEYDRKYRK